MSRADAGGDCAEFGPRSTPVTSSSLRGRSSRRAATSSCRQSIPTFSGRSCAVPASAVIVGPYRGSLSNGGERVRLQRPSVDGEDVLFVSVDEVRYDDAAAVAYGFGRTRSVARAVGLGRVRRRPRELGRVDRRRRDPWWAKFGDRSGFQTRHPWLRSSPRRRAMRWRFASTQAARRTATDPS